MMRGCRRAIAVTAAAVVAQCAASPPAGAADGVTYEIVSGTVALVDVEYADRSGRTTLTGVALPWRLDVATGGPTAQVRADWRPLRAPGSWVTVRILQGGRMLCQSTLDVGNVTCYGNTPHIS